MAGLFFWEKGFVLFNVAQGIKETEMNNYDYIAQLHKKLVTIQVRYFYTYVMANLNLIDKYVEKDSTSLWCIFIFDKKPIYTKNSVRIF